MLVSESASSLVKISCIKGVESGVTGQGAQRSPRASLHVYTHTNTPHVCLFKSACRLEFHSPWS